MVVLMLDYQIQPSTRRCSVTGRELQAGEKVYSVLLEEDGKFVRKDFGAEAWQGPPQHAFSFWVGRVSAGDQKRRSPIDDELLLDCFGRLEGQIETERVNFRFVLALLLMRKRRLKLQEARTEDGQEVLYLRCNQTGLEHRVVNPNLSEAETAVVQQDLFRALGWE
jgi:hypothetical protein